MLEKGLFPKELPRNFTGKRAAAALRAASTSTFPAQNKSAALLRHSLARAGGVRRVLGIPNPVPFFGLATAIETNLKTIKTTCAKSPWSLSRPRLRGTEGRCIVPVLSLADLNERRARARGLGRYLLSVDLAEYYRSIYTHSIPWALHGKAQAKLSRGRAGLVGDQLDLAVRRCQLDETMGLPVGPDSSFLLGEAILSAVDREIAQSVSPESALRYYDDYEFTFRTLREAEQALAVIQATLGDYNLLANSAKTQIQELPRAIDSRWTSSLSGLDLTAGAGLSHRLIRFFDAVVENKAATRDSQVVGYAISRLDDPPLLASYSQGIWNLIESTLLHLAVTEPSAIVALLRLLAKVRIGSYSFSLNLDLLRKTLNEIIHFSAHLGHSSEVSWAVWGLIAFDLKLDAESVAAISAMPDSVVALLALDAQSRKLTELPLDTTMWQAYTTSAGLYGPQWLLSYEAPVQKWVGSTTHIQADPNFSIFLNAKARFYTRFRRLDRKVVEELDLWSSDYDDGTGEFDGTFGVHHDDDDDDDD